MKPDPIDQSEPAPAIPDRPQGEALAELAHDLRSPLAAIRALAEVLRDDPAMPIGFRNDLLDRIVAETQRLDQLTARLLDGRPARPGGSDVVQVVRAATDAMAGVIAGRGVRLDLHLPRDVPCVPIDADRLAQMVGNLLDNAVRHAVSRIGVSIAHVADRVELTVTDDGAGFDPLQDDGLGLPICRRIARSCGGSLHVGAGASAAAGAAFAGTRAVLNLPACEGAMPCPAC